MIRCVKATVSKTVSLHASGSIGKIKLSVLIKSLIRVLILSHRTRCLRAETLAVALAGVDRFEFRLLSRRNEMRVFFQILNDFFRDNFTLETAQRALD